MSSNFGSWQLATPIRTGSSSNWLATTSAELAIWRELAAAGASPQRCLWASTSAKNPAYRDVVYVEELIGPETVNTMPPDTIDAFEDHSRVARTIDRDVDDAHTTFEELASAGIDYGAVVETLEREGVDKFAESFDQMIDTVQSQLEAATA